MADPGRMSPAEFQVVLALVDGAKHGTEIKIDVRDRTGGAVDMGPGTLYGAIKRLLRNGWIEEVTDRLAAPVDDDRLRYYAATPEGLEAARAEASRLAALVGIALDKELIGG